ncbi:MAG: sigma factor [Nitrospiraceae bacterium]
MWPRAITGRFSQLYDQSSTLLYALAFRILGDREEAAELIQEVYLEVWRKIARYDAGRGADRLVGHSDQEPRDRPAPFPSSRGQRLTVDSLEHPLVSQTPDVSPNPGGAGGPSTAAGHGEGDP